MNFADEKFYKRSLINNSDEAEILTFLYYSAQLDEYKINIQQQYKVKSCDEIFETRQVDVVYNRLWWK
jgi:hypothetical protein